MVGISNRKFPQLVGRPRAHIALHLDKMLANDRVEDLKVRCIGSSAHVKTDWLVLIGDRLRSQNSCVVSFPRGPDLMAKVFTVAYFGAVTVHSALAEHRVVLPAHIVG